MSPEVLFTTAVFDPHHYADSCNVASKRFLKYRNMYPSPGLRFLKRNIPQIEILEYPTWEEYCQKLEEGWDVVGFSFYLYETNRVLGMIREARRHGVKQIWGGNYGVLTPGIQKYFDRIFIGYSEKEVGKALGVKVEEIRHPILLGDLGFPFLPLKTKLGALFTSRGCNIGCFFCQTPSFCPRVSFVSLSSVREVLEEYYRRSVRRVYVGDENFGTYRKYSEMIVDMLDEHGFEWFCQTRPDILDKRAEEWREKGLEICSTGVESFSQNNLDFVSARKDPSKTLEVIKKLHDNGVKVCGYFIIGYPSQSESDIKREIEELASLDLNSYRITILTPFPRTPLWDMLSRYGPFDPDYSKYDCLNLVWNHPKISKGRMRELLFESFDRVYPCSKHVRNMLGLIKTVILRAHPVHIGW